MTNIDFNYPILLIKDKDINLYGLKKDLGLISKGGDNFYKPPMKTIDSNGSVYELKKSKIKGKARLIDSLRFFQPMQQMQLEFTHQYDLNLNDLKKLILDHIRIKPKKFLAMGTIDMIEKDINEQKSIKDLIRIFI